MLHGLLRRTLVGGGLLLVSLTPVLSAQRLAPPGPRDTRMTQPVQSNDLHRFSRDSAAVHSTHWQTGALIGGIAGLVVGALLVALDHAECESKPCNVHPVYIVVPTALFAVIGALIGSAVPRSH